MEENNKARGSAEEIAEETIEEIMEEAVNGEGKKSEASKENRQQECQNTGFWKDDRGVGVIEIVLILVVIFTIYKGCK